MNYRDKLESERLITRMLISQDVAIWEDFFADEEAVKYFPDFGFTSHTERANHWISKQLDRYASGRFGLQVLIDKNSSEFIGQCGLLTQEIDGIEELEVGYHIFKKYWGRGYAPEAAGIFISFAFENDLADSVISIIDTRNLKSQRVAEKNGLIREKQTEWNGKNVFVYRIDRKKWEL